MRVQEAAGGHYTCDVRLTGPGGSWTWVRFDDDKVTPITAADVERPGANRDPYLLFYQRADLCPPEPTPASGPRK